MVWFWVWQVVATRIELIQLGRDSRPDPTSSWDSTGTGTRAITELAASQTSRSSWRRPANSQARKSCSLSLAAVFAYQQPLNIWQAG
jgi:hypothetical protein